MEVFNPKRTNAALAVLVCFVLLCLSYHSSAGIRDSLQASYENQVGVRELTGNNDGARVEAYLSTCGLGKGYAWCAAFVEWNFEQVGIETQVTQPAWSPSWFADSTKVVYRKTWLRADYKSEAGQVFGLYFSSKGRVAHVGFINAENSTSYFTVEGNTNGAGSREGDGVYRKIRPKNTIYIVADYVRERKKEEQVIDWRQNTIYINKRIRAESRSNPFRRAYQIWDKRFWFPWETEDKAA